MRSFTRVRRILVVVATTLVGAVPVMAVGAPGAGAALRPVTGCGFTLGPVSENGAAGTLFFMVDLRPSNPSQECTTTVTFQASITPDAIGTTGPYTDIDGNPLSAAQTVTFV